MYRRKVVFTIERTEKDRETKYSAGIVNVEEVEYLGWAGSNTKPLVPTNQLERFSAEKGEAGADPGYSQISTYLPKFVMYLDSLVAGGLATLRAKPLLWDTSTVGGCRLAESSTLQRTPNTRPASKYRTAGGGGGSSLHSEAEGLEFFFRVSSTARRQASSMNAA